MNLIIIWCVMVAHTVTSVRIEDLLTTDLQGWERDDSIFLQLFSESKSDEYISDFIDESKHTLNP